LNTGKAKMASNDAPIGLFDSGIGGLTVLRTLRQRLPRENFVYLGDTARLPYGTKSPETIRRYLRQNMALLEKYSVKAAIVACNSASTALLGTREAEIYSFPVYNVIEPGAQAAIAAAPGLRIGVLGTRATVASGAYARAIHKLAPGARVFCQAAPLLVPLVEEGWEDDPITNLVIYRYLKAILAEKPEALILGCTHYPALRAGVAKASGPGVALVDSADAIADILQADLAAGRFAARREGGPGSVRLLATDVSPTFAEMASRLLGLPGAPSLELVDLGC
jgi:glutamate racemase